MTRVLADYVEPPRECAYLPGRQASHHVRVLSRVALAEHEDMLVRGWRHQGIVYFRPQCEGCQACICLRIPVATFQPTRSQLRARRRCARFRITLSRPVVDDERLGLYHAWHAARETHHGWEPSPLGADEYLAQFAFPHPAARELTFHDGDRLVAVGIHDVSPRLWSAVYFFYDPAVARLSPGVANIMFSLDMARAQGIPHVYLGYRVEGCESMRYKGGFGPHELLEGRPDPGDHPAWARAPL
jgi:arginyl-tRNA--protein-N-Asp/Glu arginylyltransferase